MMSCIPAMNRRAISGCPSGTRGRHHDVLYPSDKSLGYFRMSLRDSGPLRLDSAFIHIELIVRSSADRWPSESVCLGRWLAIQAILGDRTDGIGRANAIKMAANYARPQSRRPGIPVRLRTRVTIIRIV